MTTFLQMEEELDLYLCRMGGIGKLYLPRSSKTSQRVRDDQFDQLAHFVRHFDTDQLSGLVEAYADVVQAIQQWIDDRADLGQIVRVQPLTEVGSDYVVRRFIPFAYSISDYDNPEESELTEVIPAMLGPMRERVRAELEQTTTSGRAAIVDRVIADSLIGSSESTIAGNDSFLIVSPVVSIEQLEEWVATPEH